MVGKHAVSHVLPKKAREMLVAASKSIFKTEEAKARALDNVISQVKAEFPEYFIEERQA